MASRPARGSRTSSPFVAAPKPTSAEMRNKKANESAIVKNLQTSLDGWVEPALPQARPSFADAGIERHGAVATMQPLGTLPSGKVIKQVLALEAGEAMVRSSSAKRSGLSNASTPAPSVMTPEPTVNNTSQASPLEAKADDVFPPPQTPKRLASPAKTLSPPETELPTPAQETFPELEQIDTAMEDSTPAPEPPSRLYSGSPSNVPLAVGPDGLALTNIAQTDRVVVAAVQEAIDRKRFPTAYALRILYDKHRDDQNFIRMIEAVSSQHASEETLDEFERLMKPKKVEGRKERTAEYYFTGGSDPAPAQPSQATTTTSTSSIANTVMALFPPPTKEYKTPYSSIPAYGPHRSGSVPTFARDTPPPVIIQTSHSVSPPQMESDEHIAKKQKTSNFPGTNIPVNDSFGSVSSVGANGTMTKSPAPESSASASALSAMVPANGTVALVAQMNGNSKPKGRSNSNSSVSSLSSVDENLIKSTGVSPAGPRSHTKLPSAPIPFAKQHALASFGASRSGGTPFVSPYASTSQFKQLASSAETLARSRQTAQPPIKPVVKTGPKIHTFSVIPKPSTSSSSTPTPAPSAATSSTPQPPAPSSFVNNFSAINASDKQSSLGKEKKSSSTTTQMPGLVASNNSSTTTQVSLPISLKLQNKKLGVALPPDNPEKLERKTRVKDDGRKKTNNYHPEASNERHKINPSVDPENETASEDGNSVAVEAPLRPAKRTKIRLLNTNNPNTRTTRRATAAPQNDDSSDLSSPTFLSFQSDIAPGSLPASRAGTPSFVRSTRKGGKPGSGTGLRVKSSPMKKKTTIAGIPRANGEKNSPDRNGAVNQDENDDSCAGCGGNGELVCCDGQDCTRAFHFRCLDPPISQDDAPDASWFCNECNVKINGHQPAPHQTSLFGSLLTQFDEKNPVAFHLPKDVRDRFEEVKTGPEGEYEEFQKKPFVNTKLAFVDAARGINGKSMGTEPDKYMAVDKEGKVITCHSCNLPAKRPDRVIWPCTYCTQWWHLDCLPNPLAKEPPYQRPWRCPSHVDDITQHPLAPAHRNRRIKGSIPSKNAQRRGLPNNGDIQIENAPDPVEEEPQFAVLKEFGRTQVLPEDGIVLDFLSTTKRKKERERTIAETKRVREEEDARDPSTNKRVKPFNWNARSFEERGAAHNLEALGMGVTGLPDLSPISMLVQTLIQQAPPEVVQLLCMANPDRLAQKSAVGNPNPDQKTFIASLNALISGTLIANGQPVPVANAVSRSGAPSQSAASARPSPSPATTSASTSEPAKAKFPPTVDAEMT